MPPNWRKGQKVFNAVEVIFGVAREVPSISSNSINCLNRFLSHSIEWYYLIYAEFDWINARHFDYRGLIKKGLAPEAPENMYNNKN